MSMKVICFFVFIITAATVSGQSAYPKNTEFKRKFKVYCDLPFKIQKDVSGTLFDADPFIHERVAEINVDAFGYEPDTGRSYATLSVYTKGVSDPWYNWDVELFMELHDICYQGQDYTIVNVFKDEYDATLKCRTKERCEEIARDGLRYRSRGRG